MPHRVAISGASGFIGAALSSYLIERGDEVLHLVRRPAQTSAEIRWTPGERLDPQSLAGVTAVVHLAGAGVADKRWSAAYQATIRRSRVEGTRTVAQALAELPDPVRFVSGSAVGIYGSDRQEEPLTEGSAPGSGFLAEVVRAWEAQTEPAARTRHPVALARTGIVLAPSGGAMSRLMPLARLGLAGPVGTGLQYWPWITLTDEVRALAWLVDHPEVTGPVNLVAPTPARQGDLMREIGAALGRPAVVPAPAPAIRLILGGFADEVLGSQLVTPTVLMSEGFSFVHPDPKSAAAWLANG